MCECLKCLLHLLSVWYPTPLWAVVLALISQQASGQCEWQLETLICMLQSCKKKKKKSIKKTIIIITRPCGDECKRALCCQLLPINICQWRWEEAKTNGSFICAAKQTIWILSTWVMLIVLSSIIGQSVGHHQVDLRSLSPSVPSWARWALH